MQKGLLPLFKMQLTKSGILPQHYHCSNCNYFMKDFKRVIQHIISCNRLCGTSLVGKQVMVASDVDYAKGATNEH